VEVPKFEMEDSSTLCKVAGNYGALVVSLLVHMHPEALCLSLFPPFQSLSGSERIVSKRSSVNAHRQWCCYFHEVVALWYVVVCWRE
jgi:hypothetical protein